MQATEKNPSTNPMWSYKDERFDVPAPILKALRALLTWGEEHGLDNNSFSAAELEAYKGIHRRRAYALGAWLKGLQRDIHWVDSEGVYMRLRIAYERGQFFVGVLHIDADGHSCDDTQSTPSDAVTCTAMLSGLHRVVGQDPRDGAYVCATQRHGVGRYSCDAVA